MPSCSDAVNFEQKYFTGWLINLSSARIKCVMSNALRNPRTLIFKFLTLFSMHSYAFLNEHTMDAILQS